MDVILQRRSIRKYTNKKISQEIIKELLRAGFSAPSANNKKPWFFYVIEDKKVLSKIPDIHPHSQMIKEAALGILVCADVTRQENPGYYSQDCSAATENILIEVQYQGLGAVWLGVFPREDRIEGIKKLLKIEDNMIPFSLISIGYPAEQKPFEDRYDESRIKRIG